MSLSCSERVRQYKSPLRVVATFLLEGRDGLRQANRQLRQQVADLQEVVERQKLAIRHAYEAIDRHRQNEGELKSQLDHARQFVNLPEDPSLGVHGYGPRMISLALNLARAVGFRGANRVLKIFFEWLGVNQKVPSRTSIENWMKRHGVAELKKEVPSSEDMILMVDHSIQIGAEKAMVVLGINASDLPAVGQTLKHEELRVLEVKVGNEWKIENMEQEYEKLASKHGSPRAILSDGASELQKGAEILKNQRQDTLILRDLKHYAGNVMKSLVGNDPRFKEVVGMMGKTRAAIQQTELAHVNPTKPKSKARFMNLGPTIRWMSLIIWLLKHPDAKGRKDIDEERFKEKLGWVAGYEKDIAVWQECQEVVSLAVTYINTQYLTEGAADQLRSRIGNSLEHDKSREVAKRLIDLVRESEEHLRPGERLPMSTEILESGFGLFKQLERQHSKSGFTSLLVCLPVLLKPCTPQTVTESFARVTAKDTKEWIDGQFKGTVPSRRAATYAEYYKAIGGAKPLPGCT